MELNKRLEELENNDGDIVIQNEPIPNKPMLKCKGFLGKNALIKPYSDLKMDFILMMTNYIKILSIKEVMEIEILEPI